MISLEKLDQKEMSQIYQWNSKHECVYMLPHFCSSESRKLIKEFFDKQTLEGQTGIVQGAPEADHLVRDLTLEGFIQQHQGGWQLTKEAVKRLEIVHVLDGPGLVVDAQLEDDKTACTLLKELHGMGWVWQKARCLKNMDPYRLGGPKVFYTCSNVVCKEYLMCLTSAEKLLVNVPELRHGQKALYYNKLLQGDVAGALALLSEQSEKKEVGAPALKDADQLFLMDGGFEWQIDDVGVASQLPPAKRRRKQNKAPSEDAVGEWASGESDSDLAEMIARVNKSEDMGEPLSYTPSCAPEDGEVGAEVDGAAHGSSAAQASSSSVAHSDSKVPVARVQQPETIQAWGAGPQKFRITWRKPTRECKFGAWQGTCPYHRKGPRTKCTKALNVSADSESAREHCLRMIQHWLVSGPLFESSWQHSEWNPRAQETPPSEVLLAKSEAMEVPLEVVEDVDVGAGSSAKKSKPSRPKPKPKPKKSCKGVDSKLESEKKDTSEAKLSSSSSSSSSTTSSSDSSESASGSSSD